MTRWLRSMIDIREGERALTVMMILYALIVIAVLIIVKSVRQALFLQKFGAASLPYVYLLIAAVAGGIAALYQRFSRKIPIHRLVVGTMIVVIANLVLFRFLMVFQWGSLAYVLYVWVAIYGILATAQFWMLANYVYDPRQAKRLFPTLGLGATLGGIVGGYITQYTAPLIGTENMLLVGGGLLGGCVVIGIALGRTQQRTIRDAARAQRFKSSVAGKTAGGFQLIWESRYLKLVMAVIALSIVIATVVDNQFSFVVEEHIAGKDAKTAFFGQFFTWLGWAAFLTQFLLTGRLLRRFGVGVTMRVLPVAFFLGSGMFVLLPALATGVLVKIADGAFRYTTHKGSLELLYLPIPIGVKNKTKAFIDVFTDRFSKGIAALLVLFMTTVLGLHYTALSWVLMGLSVVWIGVTVLTRREYVAAFRDALMRRRIDEDDLVLSQTDAATVGALAEALESAATPAAAHRALDLVAGVKCRLLSAPLVRLAHHADPMVARKALERLADLEGEVPAGQLADLLDSSNLDVVSRTLGVIACDKKGLSPAQLGAYLADPRPLVRLGAVMCSFAHADHAAAELIDTDTLERFIADSTGEGDRERTRHVLVSLLRVLPYPDAVAHSYILRCLDGDDPVIRGEAVAAAGRLRPRQLVEPLIRLLADRRLRYKVRDALAAYGDNALGTLADYFSDQATDRRIRRYIPRIIERIPVQRAVDILVARLSDPDERVRFASLRSLGRLRAHSADLDFSHGEITRRLEMEIRKAYRYQSWVLGADADDAAALLRKTLDEKTAKTIDRVFRLLAMRHPPAEVYAASRALYSPNARIRANAVEYLDNVLGGDYKSHVLGLVEDQPRIQRVRRVLAAFGQTGEDWSDALASQAGGDDDWLAACALYTVWATHHESLFGLIVKPPGPSDPLARPLVRETAASLRPRLKMSSG